MTIETTINGGLPVKVSGSVVWCSPHEYPGHEYIDDLKVCFLSGHRYWRNLSKDDSQRIVEEMMDAWDEGPTDA